MFEPKINEESSEAKKSTVLAISFSVPKRFIGTCDAISSEQLATSIKTNASFVRKLVVSLSNAGLVESVRGKAGGVRLAKNPKLITLDQIYKAVTDNTFMPVPDKTPNKNCEISCGMGDVLCKISKEIEESTFRLLSKKNLAEILNQVKKP